MKYRCKTEPYRHFMGRLFMNYKPIDITDMGTLMAIEKHPDFEKVEAGEKKIVLPDECPKCGRIVKRGKVMHAKYCQGKK